MKRSGNKKEDAKKERIHTHSEREREIDRLTDRQTDKQTNRQTDRQTDTERKGKGWKRQRDNFQR